MAAFFAAMRSAKSIVKIIVIVLLANNFQQPIILVAYKIQSSITEAIWEAIVRFFGALYQPKIMVFHVFPSWNDHTIYNFYIFYPQKLIPSFRCERVSVKD